MGARRPRGPRRPGRPGGGVPHLRGGGTGLADPGVVLVDPDPGDEAEPAPPDPSLRDPGAGEGTGAGRHRPAGRARRLRLPRGTRPPRAVCPPGPGAGRHRGWGRRPSPGGGPEASPGAPGAPPRARRSVLEVCRRHFAQVDHALRDERVRLHLGDAFESVLEFEAGLDVILCDLTDPIGEAARLFEEPFYRRCRRALREPGMMVAQIESIHLHRSTVVGCRQAMGRHFARTDLLWAAMATYPGAWWTFGAGTTGFDPRQAHHRPDLRTRLYHPDAHTWFFIPRTVQETLLA